MFWFRLGVKLFGRKWRKRLLQAVENAKALGVSAITFTYTDPSVLFEYVYDVFKVARAAGLATLLKSNGYWISKSEATRSGITGISA